MIDKAIEYVEEIYVPIIGLETNSLHQEISHIDGRIFFVLGEPHGEPLVGIVVDFFVKLFHLKSRTKKGENFEGGLKICQ